MSHGPTAPASTHAPREPGLGVTRAELAIGGAVLIAGWLCVAALSSSASVLAPSAGGGYTLLPWAPRFARQLVAHGWWLPIAPCVALAARWMARARLPVVVQVAGHVLLLAASVSLYAWARRHGTPAVTPSGDRRLATYQISREGASGARRVVRTDFPGARSARSSRVTRSDLSSYPTGLTLHVLTVGLTLLGDATRRRRAHEDEARRLARESEELRVSLVDAQLRALRMQLNPHFLYNTLNSIAALVVVDPPLAQRMIATLGQLLRGTLEGGQVSEVTCARELEWLEEYLELQQLRFGERLDVSLHAAPDALAAMVPFLILQPLVENAIEHGVGDAHHAGRIEVVVERRGDRLLLEVRDNGAGPSGARDGSGIGLRNTRDRLRATYRDDFGFELLARPGGGTIAHLDLPFRVQPAGMRV